MLLMLAIYLASICCCFATASPSWYYMFPDGSCTIADLLRKTTMLLYQCIASTITIVITIGICIGVCLWSSQCAVCEWVSDTGLL